MAEDSKRRFVIIGGGKMGEAILSGWLASDETPADAIGPSDMLVVEPDGDRRAFLSDAYGVACIASASEVPAADVVVLSVKPQVMMGLLAECRELESFQATGDGPLFVSIAAGLTTDSLVDALPAGVPLVRVMPNMPLMVGAGASAVCASSTSTEDHVAYVANLFSCLGRAVVVDESEMDAVCAVSGSGPAYVAAMVEALRDAGVSEGLEADLAETLALHTVLGTARLIAETGVSPEDARIAVCSPGGTTLAALDAMNAAGFADVFQAGVSAAVRRSKELAQCS